MLSCSPPPKRRLLPAVLGLTTLFSLAAPPSLLPSARAQVSVLTQNNDNARTGANIAETTLTPANVNTVGFGKQFTITGLDANVNGQTLYVPNVVIKTLAHNVLYIYTSNNTNNSPCSLYAYDADTGTQLWHTPLHASATYTTATPVIDPATRTMYVLTKSDTDDTGATYLHAVDITTGAEKPGSPIQVQASVPGTGDGSVNGVVSFDGPAKGTDRFHANERPGLLLLNGYVYVGFAHNSDSYPYHGWLLGYHYDGTQFTQTAKFCTTPNGGEGGIWQAGKGLVADANGYIYCSTGNGTFDADQAGGQDYGMCYLKLHTPDLTVADWFAPYNEKGYSDQDLDLGNSGVVAISGTNRLFGGGTKFGSGFLLDSTNLGGFTPNGPDKSLLRLDGLTNNDSVGQNPIAWNMGSYKYVYLWAQDSNLEQFRYDPNAPSPTTPGTFNPAGIYKQTSGMTNGGSLAVSASGAKNAILWAVGGDNVVRALDATDVSLAPFWTSAQNNNRDRLGSVGHFQFPTVVDGKVYVPTNAQSVVVYGLLNTVPVAVDQINSGGAAAAPFTADQYFTGGQTMTTTAAIDTSGVVNPAPQAVYQSARLGRFTYDIPNLTPGATYTVRLHFAETVETAPGKRLVNGVVNNVAVLAGFDIFAAAGGPNKAVTEQFTTVADYTGQIYLRFAATGNSPDPNAELNGIEVLH